MRKIPFPSLDWAKELAERLNALPEYRDSSENWEGTLVMAVLAEPGKLDRNVAFWLDPTGGSITDVRLVDHDAERAEYVLLGRYSVWRDIIEGKHDILGGVMTGKIKLRGSVFRLMLQLKTPEIILREMRNVPTEFAS